VAAGVWDGEGGRGGLFSKENLETFTVVIRLADNRVGRTEMKVLHKLEEWQPGKAKACLAIGFFDGVHLGHQQIVRQTVGDARRHDGASVVVTFDRHPNTVVAPERVPPLIYPLCRKVQAVRSLGVDFLLMLRFDEAFSRQSGEAFVRALAGRFAPIQTVCVGGDFVFGYKRSGNVELLRKLGGELGFQVHGQAAVSLDGQVVSSTRIRECIRAGDLDAAGQMLGRPYSLNGKVVYGDRRGREMGFPTANVDTEGLVVPPNGVYAVLAACKGDTRQAVLNIGNRPTLGRPQTLLRVEAHLLDFSGDLYGADMELTFLSRLREEQRFDSLAALHEQIARDIAEARKLF
jgi:riboflavin kinase/FMN adenylyltransferase